VQVSVIGQGYVGLPLALEISKSGHVVNAIDKDEKLVEEISSGLSPILDVSDQDITSVINSGNYTIANSYASIASSEVVIICVPTPLDQDRNPDLTYLISAVTSIAKHMQSGVLIINESTVSPGTTRGIIKEILDTAGVDYDLGYSPERIDPANKKWNIANTPKLVSGTTPHATKRVASFYKSFLPTVIVGSSTEVIETAKLLENTFRLVNISFINEFAQFCAALKIDVREVIDAAATKPYGYMPFYPSVGIGGHCIPVDPLYLTSRAVEINAHLGISELAIKVNDNQPNFFAEIAKLRLGELNGKKILMVGISYKPNVSDIRESAAIKLIEELRKRGAIVNWHDNLVAIWNGESSSKLSNDYDLLIVANLHAGTDLRDIDESKILDTSGGY
jgi:UDP-N-acetyl-D-glucosamine dehydrogenase